MTFQMFQRCLPLKWTQWDGVTVYNVQLNQKQAKWILSEHHNKHTVSLCTCICEK